MADIIEEKEEDKEDVSSAPIKEMISKWIYQQGIAEKYNPDTVITNITVNIFNDNVMAHSEKYQGIDKNSKHWTMQISPEPKRERIVVEEDNERDFPQVIIEGDFPSKQ